MAKKGLDQDRLTFFKGMGGAKTSESDEIKSAISESDKMESGLSDSDKSESDKKVSVISESEKTESNEIKSAISESDKRESELSDSDKSDSDKSESAISESDSDNPESDKIALRVLESDKSESDNRKSTNKRKSQASKIPLPRSRSPSTIPKIRAKKVDDSVLDQAILAASKSPKVSIYSPFVAAVMKCNELTTIGYKTSADSRELLEKALEQAYPDVCAKVRRYMDNK